MTTNHPAHSPVSLDRLHQIREILSKAAAQSDGGNLGYAMADAVKVIDEAIAERNAKPVPCPKCNDTGMADSGGVQPWGEPILIECDCRAAMLQSFGNVEQLDTAPARLVNTIDETLIEALRLVQCMLDDYRERNYGHAQEWIRHISAKMDDYSEQHGDDAYSVISAAMLQAGNHTEQHLDMVDHSGDANKMVTGNSPVITDCSCRTCRPVTFTDSRFVVCPECGNKRCPHANDHRNACTGSNEPGQEGSAYPAAPQQK
ncbi:hypothetical protein AAIG28_08650 [Citrobacter freundii]|uniref:hypothetical protein n=1 Tax=Citrobacter freundii TaxID=546 RepID=UPI0031B7C184